jgi:hypothetical protein
VFVCRRRCVGAGKATYWIYRSTRQISSHYYWDTVSRVQGGWRDRGGYSLRTDATARCSLKSKLQLKLVITIGMMEIQVPTGAKAMNSRIY